MLFSWLRQPLCQPLKYCVRDVVFDHTAYHGGYTESTTSVPRTIGMRMVAEGIQGDYDRKNRQFFAQV